MSTQFSVGVVAYADQRVALLDRILEALMLKQRECIGEFGDTDALIARMCWAQQQLADDAGLVSDLLALAVHRAAQAVNTSDTSALEAGG